MDSLANVKAGLFPTGSSQRGCCLDMEFTEVGRAVWMIIREILIQNSKQELGLGTLKL